MQLNDGPWETCPQVTALCIGNAKYFGGGMKITPNADPFSRNLEVKYLPVKCKMKIIIYFE